MDFTIHIEVLLEKGVENRFKEFCEKCKAGTPIQFDELADLVDAVNLELQLISKHYDVVLLE